MPPRRTYNERRVRVHLTKKNVHTGIGNGELCLLLLWLKRRGDFHSPGLWALLFGSTLGQGLIPLVHPHRTDAERRHALAVLAVLVAERVDEDTFFDAQAWKDYHAATHHVHEGQKPIKSREPRSKRPVHKHRGVHGMASVVVEASCDQLVLGKCFWNR